DSDGPLPETRRSCTSRRAAAAFAEVAEAIHAELLKRHGLKGLVVGGLCGAATTSLYLADRAPEGVSGVFLFEPEFYLSEQEAAGAGGEAPAEESGQGTWRSRLPLRRVTSKLFSYWGWMRMLTRENEYARLFRYVPFPRQFLLDLLMDWGTLPAVANVPLVRAWQRVVERGVPVLVITAEGKLRDVFFDRIHRAAFSDLKVATLERLRLRGTNHIFTTGGAIDACIGHLSRWAGAHFAEDAAPVAAMPHVAELRGAG
ncbi:hypothetical protein ACLESD_41490, partial [Pyxidicoccus sp. 3LFB2]